MTIPNLSEQDQVEVRAEKATDESLEVAVKQDVDARLDDGNGWGAVYQSWTPEYCDETERKLLRKVDKVRKPQISMLLKGQATNECFFCT